MLIGALVASEGRSGADDLYSALVLALKNGLEQGYGDSPTRVDSYDALIQRANMKAKMAVQGYLETGSMQTVLGQHLPLAKYVGIQLLKRDRGLALQISIFAPNGSELVKIGEKLVTTDQGEDELLQLTTEAGCHIARHSEGEPVLQLNRPEQSQLTLGDELVLDASASQDPDFDVLRWSWKQIKLHSNDETLLGTGGSVRSVLRLRPSKAGTYQFCVAVSDKQASKGAPESAESCVGPRMKLLTIDVGSPPTAPHDSFELLDAAAPYYVLSQSCPAHSRCEYSQIAGPEVAPKPSLFDGSKSEVALAYVKLAVPGLYKFQFLIRSDFGSARQTTTIAVAPPPVAIIDAPTTIFDTNVGALDASGSYDPLGQPLTYLWTLSSADSADALSVHDCQAFDDAGKAPGAYVTNPTNIHTSLRTTTPGKYVLTLRVTATRTFDGHSTAGTACASQPIEVVRRRFEFYLSSRGKFGGPASETIQLGVLVGGSVAIGSKFRFHAYQVAFRNSGNTTDGLKIRALGGTHFDLSYELPFCDGYFLRPMVGAATRAASSATADAGPRAEFDFGYHISRPFVIIAGPAFDDEYASEDKKWHPSFEASVSLGVVL